MTPSVQAPALWAEPRPGRAPSAQPGLAGENAKAREALQQALSLNPTLPEGDDVKRLLASLPR